MYEEDLEKAEQAYKLVSTHGRSSFSEDAIKRSSRLNKVKHLVTSSSDSTSKQDIELARARFLKAELFLFQQDRPGKAIEEYEAIQRDFAGTDFEGKAALAEAYVRFYIQEDAARGRAALGEVMRRFGDTEFGVYARRILKGPEPEPKPYDFAGPGLDVLLAEENLTAITSRDSSLLVSLDRQDEKRSFTMEDVFNPSGDGSRSGVDPVSENIPEALQRILNLDAVPAGGNSPILNAWDREPRKTRNRLTRGFPYQTDYATRQKKRKTSGENEKSHEP